MSYHERKTITMIASTIIVFVVYALVLYSKYRNGDFAEADPLRLVAAFMILFISLFACDIAAEITQFRYYRRGF